MEACLPRPRRHSNQNVPALLIVGMQHFRDVRDIKPFGTDDLAVRLRDLAIGPGFACNSARRCFNRRNLLTCMPLRRLPPGIWSSISASSSCMRTCGPISWLRWQRPWQSALPGSTAKDENGAARWQSLQRKTGASGRLRSGHPPSGRRIKPFPSQYFGPTQLKSITTELSARSGTTKSPAQPPRDQKRHTRRSKLHVGARAIAELGLEYVQPGICLPVNRVFHSQPSRARAFFYWAQGFLGDFPKSLGNFPIRFVDSNDPQALA